MKLLKTRETEKAAIAQSGSYRINVGDMRLDDIADPGYETHPAYGGAFRQPGWTLRVQALATLAPWLAFAVAKQLLLGDRLPSFSREGDGIEGGLMRRALAAPRYLPILAKIVWRAAITKKPTRAGDSSSHGPSLNRDGVMAARLTKTEREALLQRVAEPLARIQARRERSEAQTFKGNQECFTHRDDGPLFAFVAELLARHGLLDAASTYLGRPAAVTRLLVQVNDPRDTFLYNSFPDVGLSNSRTNYMHIDRAYGCLKCVIYLNEVSERNGPFCYIPGSNRMNCGALGGVVRRAVDRAGLAECDRATRRLFMALPKTFRKKSAFGCDLLDGTPNSELLLHAEYRFTSDQGNVVMFDNLGIHRGALVLEGHRVAMFATLA